MTDPTTTGVLRALLELPVEQRLEFLNADGNARKRLHDLVEETRRWLITDLGSAIDATAALVDLADAVADPEARARARRTRGQALAYANRFDDALAVWREGAEIATPSHPVEAARAKMAMVHALARQGHWAEAIAVGEEARQAFLASGEAQLAAKADANLGETLRLSGDPGAALLRFDRARAAVQDDVLTLALLDNNRGQALLDLNRFAEAEAAFDAASAALQTLDMHRGIAIVEGNLADLMSRQGRLPGAIRHFEQARRYFEKDDARGDLARLLAEQADAFVTAGLFNDAVDAYREALPDLAGHGLAVEHARGLLGLGRVLTRVGLADEAGETLDAAAEAFDALDHDAGRGIVRLAQGELAWSIDDRSTAGHMFHAALERLGDWPASAAIARTALANVAIAGGDLDAAGTLLGDALAVAGDLDVAPVYADVLLTRGRMHLALGRRGDAIDDLRHAIEHIERIRGTLQAGRLRASFLGGRLAAYELLVSLLLASANPEDANDAFHVIEMAKGRSLVDLVAGAIDEVPTLPGEAADADRSGLVDTMAGLRAEMNGLYSRLADPGGAEREAPPAAAWTRQVRTLEQRLQRVEMRLAATQGIGGLFASPIDAESARRILASDQGLLQFFAAGDQIHACLIDAKGAVVTGRPADRAVVAETIDRFQFQLCRVLAHEPAARNDPTLLTDARRELGLLHEQLLEPFADRLAGLARLIISPHGELHAIPFQALYDGRQHLLETHEVTSTPSVTLLHHLAEHRIHPAGAGTLVVGVPDPAAPHIEGEALAIAGELPGATLLLGADATIDRFVEASRGNRLIHLACHARFSSASPLSSALRLADGWLTVRSLYGLELDGATVVLSGCDTGRNAVAAGDELMGLTRGLFAAGAGEVIVSQWTLDDHSARNVMAKTYKIWENDRPNRPRCAGALRRAMLELMERAPHPMFWSPFVLVGGAGART